jgi:NTP pyrophosphatase (non-canonical NTP hydrolase)
MVGDENLRQLDKWGVQTRHPAEWLMYIMEELGELSQAISEHLYWTGNVEDVISEAIQVSTLSLKVAEMYSCPECWK